jgi:GT2 family glycosyltransferase
MSDSSDRVSLRVLAHARGRTLEAGAVEKRARGRRTASPAEDSRRALIVLGMHRSGTSALTRVLNLVGADLPGRLLEPRPDNELGYWESAELMETHDRLLASAGSSWQDFSAFPASWFKSDLARGYRQEVLTVLRREFGSSPLFVVKDPRICRLVPFWLEALRELGADPLFILCFRNPLEVADSLKVRNGFHPARGLLLWLRHVVDAEIWSRDHPRSFLSYESLLRDWRSSISRVGRELGVHWPRLSHATDVAVEAFLHRDRRHSVLSARSVRERRDVVEWVRVAYNGLLEAERRNDSRLRRNVNRIAKQMTRADLAFGPVLAEAQAEFQARQPLERQLAVSREDLTRREAEIAGLEAEHRAEIARLQEHIAGQNDRAAGLEAEHRAEVARLQEHIAGQNDRIAALERAIAEKDLRRRLRRVSRRLAQAVRGVVTLQLARQVRGWWRRRRDAPLIAGSGLFDPAWYLRRYPDVAVCGEDPLVHYLRNGPREGRDPNPLFDTSWYLEQNPDVARVRINPLSHYLRHGAAEGRDPNPLFDTSWYLEQNPDVARAGINPLSHYLHYGAAEGRDPRLNVSSSCQAPGDQLGRLPAGHDHSGPGHSPHGKGHRPLRLWVWDGVLRGARVAGRRLLPPDTGAGATIRRHLARRRRRELAGAASTPAPAAPTAAAAPAVTVTTVAVRSFLRDPYAKLAFPVLDPAVSIVVVTFNKVEYTYRCLESLLAHADVGYELIVVDNASGDETGELLSRLQNVAVARNTENLGFLRGCNQGAAMARGRYLLFLNNDTVIASGCLSALLGSAEADSRCGAVGGRLIWPDGRLQEAGGILWRDGSAQGYGRGEDPYRPEFSYVREVDFCSGALLLVRKDLLDRLGGFDVRYAPAYYEDADLCMEIRRLGYRVLYQPRAVVYHDEYTSSSAEQAVALMRQNHGKFLDKWQSELQRQPDRTRTNIIAARERSGKPRVLFVEDRVPASYMGSGYPRSHAMLQMLVSLEYQVTVFPYLDARPSQPRLAELQQAGVETICSQTDFKSFARERAGLYDLLFVSRPHNLNGTLPMLRRYFPEAPLVYDAEALYFVRDKLRAKAQGRENDTSAPGARRLELDLAGQADLVITVSEHEKQQLLASLPGLEGSVRVWGHPITPCPTPRPFQDREGLLFVGSFVATNSPNEDAILYFIREVLPLIRARIDCTLDIAGYAPPESLRACASEHTRVVGYVEDLTPYYDRCRIFIVPHRYSAGISLKLCEAMGRGLPAVVSDLVAAQMCVGDGREVLVGRTPQELADRVVELHRDQALWNMLREAGLAFTRERHDPETLIRELGAILADALKLQPRRSGVTSAAASQE